MSLQLEIVSTLLTFSALATKKIHVRGFDLSYLGGKKSSV